jgi:hypothetical protein
VILPGSSCILASPVKYSWWTGRRSYSPLTNTSGWWSSSERDEIRQFVDRHAGRKGLLACPNEGCSL